MTLKSFRTRPPILDTNPHGEPFEVIILVDASSASKQTRSKVRKNGPRFWQIPNPNRQGQILVWSELTGYFGWMPLKEIKVTKLTADD